MQHVALLDCTLRDGGFINDWRFGQKAVTSIFNALVQAGIDIIEIGFLNAACTFDENRTMLPDTGCVQRLLTNQPRRGSLVVGMIDYGTCPLQHLQAAAESPLDGIRVIFKKSRMHEAIAFCRALQELGYLVFVKPVSVTDYTPQELEVLLTLAKELVPHAISIVDTYGLLAPEQVVAYFLRFDRALPPTVAIGYHAHNNLQLGFAGCRALCAAAAEAAPARAVILDATLLGMGKSAGNTPLELLALWRNEQLPHRYDVGELIAAIDSHVLPFYSEPTWGYRLPYFLAAATGTHPTYAAYLQEKGLAAKKSFQLLQQIPNDKKLYFSKDTAQALCRVHAAYGGVKS